MEEELFRTPLISGQENPNQNLSSVVEEEIVVRANRTQRFNLNHFKAEIKQQTVINTHSYLVQFAPFSVNSPLGDYIDPSSRQLVMRCDSAILPGIDLLTNDNVRRYGYGPVESVAHGVQFGQARFTWIVDRKARVISLFNDWMNSIVNFDSSGGQTMNVDTGLRENFLPYEVGYKDDYANSNMIIFVYDSKNDTVAQYQLFDVFPQRVEDIPLSWSDTDSVVRLSVQMAYTDMKITTPQAIGRSGINSDILTALTSVFNRPAGSTPAVDQSVIIN